MARPRKLNAAKVGNHNKEELEQSEMRENSLEQFKKIDVENIPDDLTENGKKNGYVLCLYYNNCLLQS